MERVTKRVTLDYLHMLSVDLWMAVALSPVLSLKDIAAMCRAHSRFRDHMCNRSDGNNVYDHLIRNEFGVDCYYYIRSSIVNVNGYAVIAVRMALRTPVLQGLCDKYELVNRRRLVVSGGSYLFNRFYATFHDTRVFFPAIIVDACPTPNSNFSWLNDETTDVMSALQLKLAITYYYALRKKFRVRALNEYDVQLMKQNGDCTVKNTNTVCASCGNALFCTSGCAEKIWYSIHNNMGQ